MATKKADISIDGRGFYTISAQTRKGNNFMRHVQGPACPTCHSTEGQYVPPGSGDAHCLHCGAEWAVGEGE